MARCRMFAGRSSRSKSPGGPPCDDANDVRDREEAPEPSAVDHTLIPPGIRAERHDVIMAHLGLVSANSSMMRASRCTIGVTVGDEKIVAIDILAAPERLRQLELAILED
jgi:hypothetical protein